MANIISISPEQFSKLAHQRRLKKINDKPIFDANRAQIVFQKIAAYTDEYCSSKAQAGGSSPIEVFVGKVKNIQSSLQQKKLKIDVQDTKQLRYSSAISALQKRIIDVVDDAVQKKDLSKLNVLHDNYESYEVKNQRLINVKRYVERRFPPVDVDENTYYDLKVAYLVKFQDKLDFLFKILEEQNRASCMDESMQLKFVNVIAKLKHKVLDNIKDVVKIDEAFLARRSVANDVSMSSMPTTAIVPNKAKAIQLPFRTKLKGGK